MVQESSLSFSAWQTIKILSSSNKTQPHNSHYPRQITRAAVQLRSFSLPAFLKMAAAMPCGSSPADAQPAPRQGHNAATHNANSEIICSPQRLRSKTPFCPQMNGAENPAAFGSGVTRWSFLPLRGMCCVERRILAVSTHVEGHGRAVPCRGRTTLLAWLHLLHQAHGNGLGARSRPLNGGAKLAEGALTPAVAFELLERGRAPSLCPTPILGKKKKKQPKSHLFPVRITGGRTEAPIVPSFALWK